MTLLVCDAPLKIMTLAGLERVSCLESRVPTTIPQGLLAAERLIFTEYRGAEHF